MPGDDSSFAFVIRHFSGEVRRPISVAALTSALAPVRADAGNLLTGRSHFMTAEGRLLRSDNRLRARNLSSNRPALICGIPRAKPGGMELMGLRRQLRCYSEASGSEPRPGALARIPKLRTRGRTVHCLSSPDLVRFSPVLGLQTDAPGYCAISLHDNPARGGGTMPSRRQLGRFRFSLSVQPILPARGNRFAAPFGRRSLECGESKRRMTADHPAIAEHAVEMLKPAVAVGIKCVQTSRGLLFTEARPCFDGGVPPVHTAVAVSPKLIIALPAGSPRRPRDGACRLDGPVCSKGGIT